jgi:hypothetical protein
VGAFFSYFSDKLSLVKAFSVFLWTSTIFVSGTFSFESIMPTAVFGFESPLFISASFSFESSIFVSAV